MSRIFPIRFAALLVGLMMVGCRANPGDKLVKQQIAFHNELAAELEKVTDKASAEAVGKNIEAIGEKYKDANTSWADLPAETRTTAMEAHKADYDAAISRLHEARKKYAAIMRGQ